MNWDWLLIRGTGVAAFAFLSVSTIWGLLLSTKVLGRAVRAKGLTYFHESLGVGSLLLTIGHLVAVYRDEFMDFSVGEILLPGVSEWRPYAIAFGVMAFYGLVGVTLSFYAKARIGQKRWRTLHFLSLGVFIGALLHGLLAGTDTLVAPILVFYAGSAAGVFGLLVIRIAGISAAGGPRRSAEVRDSVSAIVE